MTSDNATNPMQLRTEIHAKFMTMQPPSPQQQVIMDRLNAAAEQVCEVLQPVFRLLVIEMLQMKRDALLNTGVPPKKQNIGDSHARLNSTVLPSNGGTDSSHSV